MDWQRLEWYTNEGVTAWFPCRFAFLNRAFGFYDESLYEFLCDGGYGYSHLRFYIRKASPYGMEFRVVDYRCKPERTLFQGDALGLACWLVNDRLACYGGETIVIPYEVTQ